MEKNIIIQKCLVISIVFLLLSIAFSSVITARDVLTTNNDEFVDIIVRSSGDNVWENIVTLSEQEHKSLGKSIDTIKEKLDMAKTKSETIEIYKEAIIDLEKFGLFPNRMSVEHVQQLVLGLYSYPKVIDRIEELNNNKRTPQTENENIFCLVAGQTDKTLVAGLRSKIFSILMSSIFENLIIARLFFAYYGIFKMDRLLAFSTRNPISIGCTIGIGRTPYSVFGFSYANGWVHSIGLNGKREWSGSIIGILPQNPAMATFNRASAISGFTGINIIEGNNHFYMGSALKVGLRYE